MLRFLTAFMQGTPAAAWSSEMCDFSQHFGPHNIIINLTFCATVSSVIRVIIADVGLLSRR